MRTTKTAAQATTTPKTAAATKKPRRQMTLRIDAKVMDQAEAMAKQEGMPFSTWLDKAVLDYFNARKAEVDGFPAKA